MQVVIFGKEYSYGKVCKSGKLGQGILIYGTFIKEFEYWYFKYTYRDNFLKNTDNVKTPVGSIS